MLTIRQMQNEGRPWVKKNFGNRPAYWPLMGLIEEVGELSHSQLKMEQGIRGTREEHLEAIKDAVADIAIFYSDYASAMGWEMDEVIGFADFSLLQEKESKGCWIKEPHRLVLRMGKWIGKIAAAHEENDGQAGIHASRTLFAYMAELCCLYGWNMQDIVEKVWAKVMKRDWTKDARHGGETPVAEAQKE